MMAENESTTAASTNIGLRPMASDSMATTKEVKKDATEYIDMATVL